MDVFEKLDDEHGAAITYHQLGIIAQERRDFDTAESWYRKALTIRENQDDEHGAALTYHQLGIIARKSGISTRRRTGTENPWIYSKNWATSTARHSPCPN